VGEVVRVGDRLGRWTIDGTLGVGASATVYRCHRVDAPEPTFALKVPRTAHPDWEARFAREIDLLSRLDHPNIVRLVDVAPPGETWFVQELVDGPSLVDLRMQPPMAEALALAIVGQLASALAHAHARGIAHRDLKPEHVRVDASGRAVLFDLGIADARDEVRLTGTQDRSPGTPAYAPPEWFTGRLDDGPAADAYALGVVLWELCTGQPARADADTLATRRETPLALDRETRASRLVQALTHPHPARRAALAPVAAELSDVPRRALPRGAAHTFVPGSPPSPLDTAGSSIDRYVLLEVLGRGGMGVVYRAFDPELQRHVALKQTPATLDDVRLERFRREARAVAQLDHPGIVSVFDVGSDARGLYLTMELVEGRDLGARIEAEGPLPIDEAIGLAIQIGEALAHAHQRRIVHRDVKPANVLLEADRRARLTDFGLALELRTSVARVTRHGQLVGTPAYMAPEQARGDVAAIGPCSDVYALGAVLYEMLTGRPPVDDDHPARMLHQILTMEPPDPAALRSETPADLGLVVMLAMAHEPRDRYPSMSALVSDLRRASRGQRVRAARRSLVRRLGWWAQRHRSRWHVLGGVVGGAVMLWGLGALGTQLAGARAEANAQRRLEALRTTMASVDAEEADEAFQAFVTLPQTRGTTAVADAWMMRAELLRRRGDRVAERRALANGYAEGVHDGQRAEALLDLVQSQLDDWAWSNLDPTVGILLDELPEVAASPRGRELRWRHAVAMRRFSDRPEPSNEISRALEPVIEALSRARPFEVVPFTTFVRVDVDGDDEPELLGVDAEGLHGVDRQFFAGWPAGLRVNSVRPLEIDGHPHLLAVTRQDATLVRPEGTAMEVLGSWPFEKADLGIFEPATGDLDGDGLDEIYVGSWIGRRLDVIRRDAEGRWERITPKTSLNNANSEIRSSIVADLDGDGEQELLVAAGQWGAYDIRVLEIGDDPEGLELVTRAKLGRVVDAELLDWPAGPEILVTLPPTPPRPRDFRPGLHRTGLHRYRLVRDRLQPVGFTGLDGVGVASSYEQTLLGDIDGDGVDEVLVGIDDALWVGVRGPDGQLVGAPIAHLALGMVHDIDHDGDAEVIVWDDEDGTPWVLGTGDRPLPALPSVRDSLGVAPGGWLEAHGARTDDLFAMGFAQDAARKLAAMAELAGPDAGAAFLRAGRYLELEGDVEAALALYDRASTFDGVRREARSAAARCAERAHRFSEARKRGRRGLDRLVEAPSWSLPLREPLVDVSSELDPLAVRADVQRGVLHLTSLGEGVILRIPLDMQGPRFGLEVELELEELQWSTGLDIAARPVGHATEIGLYVHGRGGGGQHSVAIGARAGTRSHERWTSRSENLRPVYGTLRASVDWVPERGHAAVRFEGLGQTEFLEIPAGTERVDGPWELVIRGRETAADSALKAEFALSRLHVIGARPQVPPPDRRRTVAEHLVNGQPDAALDLLSRMVDAPRSLESQALADLGRVDEAVQRWSDVRPGDASRLARLLRVRPDLGRALVQRCGVCGTEQLWAVWQPVNLVHPDDPDTIRALTEGPLATSPLDGSTDELAAEVLLARAGAFRRAGRPAIARTHLAAAASRKDGATGESQAILGLERARIAMLLPDDDRALDALAAALQAHPAPEVLADRLVADPDLDRLHAHPRWSTVVEAARRL